MQIYLVKVNQVFRVYGQVWIFGLCQLEVSGGLT